MTKTYEIRTSNGSSLNGQRFSSFRAAASAIRRQFVLDETRFDENDGATWYAYGSRAEMNESRRSGTPAPASISLTR